MMSRARDDADEETAPAAKKPRKGRNKARREFVEELSTGLRRWIAADVRRWADESAAAAAAGERVPAGRDSEGDKFRSTGLSGAYYRVWLYSGNELGRTFGPAGEGCMKVRTHGGGGPARETLEEDDRLSKLYARVVASLSQVDQVILAYWSLATRKVRTEWCAWVAEKLGEHDLSDVNHNANGGPWTGPAVAMRISRINERIALLILDAQKDI
jgi:hypothetical protein